MQKTATGQDPKQGGPIPWNYWTGFVTCIALGLFLGVFLFIVGLTRMAVARSNFEFAEIVTEAMTYIIGFLWAGITGGLLNPFARTYWGAGFVGVISLVPMGIWWSYRDSGSLLPQDPNDLIALIAVVVIFGISNGLLGWDTLVKPRGGKAPWSG